MVEEEINWKQGLLIIIGFLFLIDIIGLFYNLTHNSGPGGCSYEDDGGWTTFGLLNMWLKSPCKSPSDKCTDLGSWGKYTDRKNDGKKVTSLCSSELNKVWGDASSRNIVKGYNMTQLLAYVIVPTMTVLGIGYGFLATNMNKSEWTFWIMIATIIATGVTSIAYDTDISVLPTQQNSLEYISSKLDLGTADELDFSFISRKQDGDECLIKGTVYGPSASKLDSEPISYSGECKIKDFL